MLACQATKIHSYDLVCRLRLPIRLGVGSQRELQLNTDHGEELTLEVAGEHGVSITDNQVWNPVHLDDSVEEDPCDGGGGVGMPQWNEVRRLREPVDDGEDHIFAMYLRRSLHDDVGGTRLVLHPEVEAHQFASPLVLRDCRQLLIQQELEAIMIC
jgi:hypothetical protein